MKTEIKLNKESNTIHVDDVDVANGVYATSEGYGNCAVLKTNDGVTAVYFCTHTLNDYTKYTSLRQIISEVNTRQFFTIPDNRRIILEKELSLDDLNISHHIGFINASNEKGFVMIKDTENVGLWQFNGWQLGSYFGKSVKDAIDGCTALSD